MTVLVAYNDSPQGEAALHAGIGEAVRRGTGLNILVLTPQDPDAGVPAALAFGLDSLPPGFPTPSITYRSTHATPAEAIVGEAANCQAGLVVIGSRKRTPVGNFLLGSTTQRVLLDSPAPVLVIKAKH